MIKIGNEICDMHGKTLAGATSIAAYSGKSYVVRNVVEWMDTPEDYRNNTFWRYIGDVMHRTNGERYTNKMLVVVGEKLPLDNDHHWFVAAYCYDGRRCGVCEIREVAADEQS